MYARSCEHATCYTNALPSEVTQCYLHDAGTQHTCSATSPKARSKVGKYQTRNESNLFPSIIHRLGNHCISSLHFPLDSVRISTYSFPYSICIQFLKTILQRLKPIIVLQNYRTTLISVAVGVQKLWICSSTASFKRIGQRKLVTAVQ